MSTTSSADIQGRWPLFAAEFLARTPYRAVICVPLSIAWGITCALDLFLTDDAQLDAVSVTSTMLVAAQMVGALQSAHAVADSPPTPVSGDEPEPLWLHGPVAQHRTQVSIAMGMTMTGTGATAVDALALLRAYAYSHDTTVDGIADDLVHGHLKVSDVGYR